MLDHAGNADADPKDGLGRNAAVREHRRQAAENPVDHDVDAVLPWLQRNVGVGPDRHGQVEQLDPDAGLTDVNPTT